MAPFSSEEKSPESAAAEPEPSEATSLWDVGETLILWMRLMIVPGHTKD